MYAIESHIVCSRVASTVIVMPTALVVTTEIIVTARYCLSSSYSWPPPRPATTSKACHTPHRSHPLLPCTPLSTNPRGPFLLICSLPALRAPYLAPQPPVLTPTSSSTFLLAQIILISYEPGPIRTSQLGSPTSNVVIIQPHSEQAISEGMFFSNWIRSH